MKGLVVEIAEKYAIILKNNGQFEKVRNNNFQVGYEINLEQYNGFFDGIIRNTDPIRKIISIAAVFIIVFGLSYAAYSYSMPYTYVSMDINPSIEIAANIFDRIINIEGINGDGKKLISSKQYKNKKVRDGIGDIIKSAVEEGYIKSGDSNILFLTISSMGSDKYEKIEKDIEEVVVKEIDTSEIDTNVYIEKIEVKKHDDAKSLGISPGKYLLIEKMKENESEMEIRHEDWKDEPVKEIMRSVVDKKDGEIFENKIQEIRQKMEKKQEKKARKKTRTKIKVKAKIPRIKIKIMIKLVKIKKVVKAMKV